MLIQQEADFAEKPVRSDLAYLDVAGRYLRAAVDEPVHFRGPGSTIIYSAQRARGIG